MKKLITKTLLFLIPFAIMFLLFFVFETYDYFGLKGNSHYLCNPLSNMRYAMNKKPSKIILGDSRMANLNADYIREVSGEDYGKLAFGGAQLGESIDMFWWATEYCELEKVVFGVNFYTSSGTQTGEDKVPWVERSKADALSVVKYATGMNYWLQAMSNAKNSIMNAVYTAIGREDKIVLNEDPSRLVEVLPPQEMGEKWRLNMENYASNDIYPAMSGFNIQPETYAALEEIIDYCEEKDIDLIFVFPPVHEVIFERVIIPLDLFDELAEFKQFFIDRATVYDMEIRSEFTSAPDSFYDGFHMLLDGKMLFARMLFTDTEEHPEMIEKHIKDSVAIIPEHLN
ncbi:MAG: hypothetical protein GX222_02325 [Ruminococcaceae bacterium]|nr:hypothetical protein [Oscillospiraceae bacterium]